MLQAVVLILAMGLVGLAQAGEITVEGAYLRANGPSAANAAGFMVITNQTGQDDRLIGAQSPLAETVALHTHDMDMATGIMRMRELVEGLAVGEGGTAELARGGHHLMFTGVSGPLIAGAMVPVTLIFEGAGEVLIEVPITFD